MSGTHKANGLSIISSALILSLTAASAPPPLFAQQDSPPPFRITTLEGEGAINNIHQIVNRAISVQVTDENRNPLSGVSVTFFLPSEGPSGLFPNGSKVLTVFTDEKGIASSRSVRFNNQVGIMPVRVVASLFAQTVSATVNQTNVGTAASVRSSYVQAAGTARLSSRGPSKAKVVLFLVAGAAAAGAGYYFATHKSTPSATITSSGGIGTPVITGPQ
jgi:hypothetical protein